MKYLNKIQQENRVCGTICTIAAISMAMMYGCFQLMDKKHEENTVKIPVGENRQMSGMSMYYNGMNNKETFSLSETWNSTNVYYPASTKEFSWNGTKFKLVSLTPETLAVAYNK
jgi:hypothetical protein